MDTALRSSTLQPSPRAYDQTFWLEQLAPLEPHHRERVLTDLETHFGVVAVAALRERLTRKGRRP